MAGLEVRTVTALTAAELEAEVKRLEAAGWQRFARQGELLHDGKPKEGRQVLVRFVWRRKK